MRYSLKLLAATVFLVSSPVEAVVTNNSSVTNNPSVANPSVTKSVVREEVKIAQVEEKKQRRDEALRLNELGEQLFRRGVYREALNNFEQALVIFREIEERQGEGLILNNIGVVYVNLGEYTKALDYYQQSLAINPSCGLQDSECEALWSRLKRQMKRCAVARSATAAEVYNYKSKKLLIL